MDGLQTGVVKKQAARPGSPRRLSGSGALAAGGAADRHVTPAHAQIVGQDGDHVLVEIVCSCGQTIHLRCVAADVPALSPEGQ